MFSVPSLHGQTALWSQSSYVVTLMQKVKDWDNYSNSSMDLNSRTVRYINVLLI